MSRRRAEDDPCPACDGACINEETGALCPTCAGTGMRPEVPSGPPEPTTPQPDLETLVEWESRGGCEATDGCWVEPDGVCPHGHEAWMRRLHLV